MASKQGLKEGDGIVEAKCECRFDPLEPIRQSGSKEGEPYADIRAIDRF
jgi:hypothetical protein